MTVRARRETPFEPNTSYPGYQIISDVLSLPSHTTKLDWDDP
jgi:hypothetical protein